MSLIAMRRIWIAINRRGRFLWSLIVLRLGAGRGVGITGWGGGHCGRQWFPTRGRPPLSRGRCCEEA
nr:MAG TPA: hypothetical protein [Caudoviricetes sp.]